MSDAECQSSVAVFRFVSGHDFSVRRLPRSPQGDICASRGREPAASLSRKEPSPQGDIFLSRGREPAVTEPLNSAEPRSGGTSAVVILSEVRSPTILRPNEVEGPLFLRYRCVVRLLFRDAQKQSR